MVQEYYTGTDTPDEGEPFPDLGLEINQTELTGPLLARSSTATVAEVRVRDRNRSCAQALNKKKTEREEGHCVETESECAGGL